jgi:tRNA(Ile)-lysidine synthase TilS/MesJ
METGEKVLLALSGGKDSMFATLVLKELGYQITPVVIDMGYEYGWGKRILGLAEKQGINAQLITIRDADFQNSLIQIIRKDLKAHLKTLDTIDVISREDITPCTRCFNVKMIALITLAVKNSFDKVVFAHHGTDAIVSLLKSALMYIDRWDRDHKVYRRSNYERLVDEIGSSFFSGYDHMICSAIYKRIGDLVDLRVVSTDEPPLQYAAYAGNRIKIIRPLFETFENSIKSYQRDNYLQTEGSGCGHGATRDTETPREMIHHRILDKLMLSKDLVKITWELLRLVKKGLYYDGTLQVDTRRERHRILGSSYKSSDGEIKI